MRKAAPPIFVRNPVRVEQARQSRAVQSLPAARYILLGLAFGVIYASLRPFSGWREPPRGWFAFLFDPIVFSNKWDNFLNVAGYAPLGFIAVLALVSARRSVPMAACLALVGCALFSFGVETLQAAMRTRTSSLVDFITNVLGSSIGVIAACLCTPWLMTEGGFLGLRRRYVQAGWRGDIGLALLAGWMFALFAPRTLLFGNGDARLTMGIRPPVELGVEMIVGVEALVTTSGLVGFALLLRLTFTTVGWPLRMLVLLLLATSLAVRATGFGLFWTSANAFLWVTPGAVIGLIVGTTLALAMLGLPSRFAAGLAALLLVATTLVVNLAPPNPHIWTKPRPTRQAELAPLSLTTRTTAMVWPLAAIGFALAVFAWPGSGRRDDGHVGHVGDDGDDRGNRAHARQG